MVGREPYDDPKTRDRELVDVTNRIEDQETRGWTMLMESKGKEQGKET
jgi:hypothetical protein